MKALIVDYGMGNLHSVRRALEECGADAVISDDPESCGEADCILLPGVGAFADGMAALASAGWDVALRRAAAEGFPLLGICLGMQLLADRGHEGGETAGLGIIPGEVRRLEPVSPNERVPHVGWNEVSYLAADDVFAGIPCSSDFYFVHSYHFVPLHPQHAIAVTPYCASFVSALRCGNVWGTQFHPEKSSVSGLRLLKNFLGVS